MERAALLEGLWSTIDAFVAKVSTRYPNDIACRPGCASCCLGGLSVTSIEAEAIQSFLDRMDSANRTELARLAESSTKERCGALDGDGRCSIYPVRPIVCRSHGIPIRFREEPASDDAPSLRRLPLIDVCPLNFESVDLDTVSVDCVLDQSTLSTALARIDGATELAAGRVELADLLATGHSGQPVDEGAD